MAKYTGQNGKDLNTKLISFKPEYKAEYDFIVDKTKVYNASQYVCELIRADIARREGKEPLQNQTIDKAQLKELLIEILKTDSDFKTSITKTPEEVAIDNEESGKANIREFEPEVGIIQPKAPSEKVKASLANWITTTDT